MTKQYLVTGYNKADLQLDWNRDIVPNVSGMFFIYTVRHNRAEALRDLNLLKTEGVRYDRYGISVMEDDGEVSQIKKVHAMNYGGRR